MVNNIQMKLSLLEMLDLAVFQYTMLNHGVIVINITRFCSKLIYFFWPEEFVGLSFAGYTVISLSIYWFLNFLTLQMFVTHQPPKPSRRWDRHIQIYGSGSRAIGQRKKRKKKKKVCPKTKRWHQNELIQRWSDDLGCWNLGRNWNWNL